MSCMALNVFQIHRKKKPSRKMDKRFEKIISQKKKHDPEILYLGLKPLENLLSVNTMRFYIYMNVQCNIVPITDTSINRKTNV